MSSAIDSLPDLVQAVLRHLFAYGELLIEETTQSLRRARRLALGIAVAFTAGVMAVALGCLWVIAATWNGPNRLTAVGGLCLGFALIALAGGAYAVGARARGVPFERLRSEWHADMREIARLDPDPVGQPAAVGATRAGRD